MDAEELCIMAVNTAPIRTPEIDYDLGHNAMKPDCHGISHMNIRSMLNKYQNRQGLYRYAL